MLADYLREHDGYRESEIVHFLMEMEDAGCLRPVLIDGTAYVIPVQVNLEDDIQEWAEKEHDWRFSRRLARRNTSPPMTPQARKGASRAGAPTATTGKDEDGPRANGRGVDEAAKRERQRFH